ncbi:MAG: ATP-binding protein [Desulforhopalus sp.]
MELKYQPLGELPMQANQEDFLMEYKYLQSLCSVVRGVTHDYNNIFMGLSGQLNLITQEAEIGGLREHRGELVGNLLTKGVKRTSLLYEFSRYAYVEKADHSLERILEVAVESLNILSRSHHFVLEKNDRLPRLHCNMKDIVMMLFYLGENGLEATAEGGNITILAEVTQDEDAIVLSVRNMGEGIALAVQSSLFHPFVTTKTPQKGLRGLGLYAARNIARDHGGTLSFKDDEIQGTTFTVRIPLPVPVTEQAKDKVLETTGSFLPISEKKRLRRKNEVFFVVEDDEAMRDLVVVGLQRRGHVVFSAETCSEAIEDFQLVHEAVTVLLIDVGLTDSDGFECLDKMLRISSQVKVVFMSGEDICESKLKHNALFIKKPFVVNQIEDLVSHAQ